MKPSKNSRLLFLFTSSLIFLQALSPLQAQAQSRPSIFFTQTAQQLNTLMNNTEANGNLLMSVSNEEHKDLPTSLAESRALFINVCLHAQGEKSSSRHILGKDYEQIIMTCQQSDQDQAVRFIFTTSQAGNHLEDLQVIRIALRGTNKDRDLKHQLQFKDGTQIVIAAGLSTLASGLLARAAYPGENDKIMHALVGNIIAATGTLISFYGFQMSENQSALVGVGLAIVVGLLKEVYDDRHRDKHTPDSNDAIATSAGGLLGGLAIRLKFEF